MRRLILTSLLLCSAVWTVAQDLNQKITYKAEAISLKKVCEELSAKTGVAFGAAAVVSSSVMIIDVKDITIKDFLDKTAFAIEGEWVQDSTGLRFQRSSTYIRKAEAEAYEGRLKGIKKNQEKMRENLEKNKKFDKEAAQNIVSEIEALQKDKPTGDDYNANRWRRVEQIRKKLPASRMSDRLACVLPPELLAGLTNGNRVVMSTTPNAMQKPIPREALPLIDLFIAEQNIWADALSALPAPDYQNGNVDWTLYQLYQGRKRLDERPAKVLLIATESGGSQAIQIEVRLLNAKGRTTTQTSTSLSIGLMWDEERSGEYTKAMEKLRTESANEPPVKLNPLADEFRKFASRSMGMSQDQKPPELSAELRNALLNPEKIDPLYLGCTDMMNAVAKLKNLQLIACPGDFMVMASGYSGNKDGPKASELLGMFSFLPKDMSPFSIDDSWLVCRRGLFTSFPGFGSVDRGVLGRVMRQVQADGRVSLDTKCEIALNQKEDDYSSLFNLYPSLVLNNSESMYAIMDNDIHMLRLHGTMSNGQKQILVNKGKLMISSLTPAQQQIVFDMVFKGSRYGQTISVSSDEYDPAESEGEMTEYYGDEPTEQFPNGIPRDAFITMDLSDQTVLSVSQSYEGQQEYPNTMSAESFGHQLAMKEWYSSQGNAADYYTKVEFKKFQLARQVSWNYNLHLKEKATLARQLNDTTPKGPKLDSMSKLPEDVQKTIQKAKEEMLKNLKGERPPDNGGGGGGGGKQ